MLNSQYNLGGDHGRSQDFSQGGPNFFLHKWKHIHLKKLVLLVCGPGFIDNNNIR